MAGVSQKELDEFERELRNGDVVPVGDKRIRSIPENPVEPSHYTKMKISPLEYIEANDCFTWSIANVIKYVSRYENKNGIEDLKKARWYLDHQIKLLENHECN